MENMTQQTCVACEQVITLSEPMPEVEYCFTCTKELNALHDASTPTEAELDVWADLWESQDNR